MDKKNAIENYFKDYIARLHKIINQVNFDDLEQVVTTLINAFKHGNTVYVCGNGGSAATASHMQADFTFFVRYFSKFRPNFIALTDNVPIMTAIGNDTSFHDIFKEQLRGKFQKDDVLICISASGNSENLIRAAEYANEKDGHTIAFVGFFGGKLNEVCKISLYTPNPKGDYGPIEDMHMIFNHVIVNYLSKDEDFLTIPATL
jgi:D-sedoheptulose 7-phosphate isomerase